MLKGIYGRTSWYRYCCNCSRSNAVQMLGQGMARVTCESECGQDPQTVNTLAPRPEVVKV